MHNYLIIIINAALIYVNAAGINTVTRQAPFEGQGVKSDLSQVKSATVQSSFLGLDNQFNWNPDYDMLEYIDTLKRKVVSFKDLSQRFSNQFSYLRDNLANFTSDEAAKAKLSTYLKDFGRSNIDSSDCAISKIELRKTIDSLNGELEFIKKNPTTITTYYTIGGRRYRAEEVVTDLEKKNSGLIELIRYMGTKSDVSPNEMDSLLNNAGYPHIQ